LTWEGNEILPDYAINVENAFQTSPRLMEFIRDKIRGPPPSGYGAELAMTDFLAHSLGTQVALDAMRLYQVYYPGAKLINTLTLIEPAIWSETFWDEARVSYGGLEPVYYEKYELQRMSWAFWFNQSAHKPLDSVNRLINSYNRDDFGLWAMIIDDYFIRNNYVTQNRPHYNRPFVLADRVSFADTPTTPLSFGALNLAHQVPAMLKLSARHSEYTIHDLEPVQGQQAMPEIPNRALNVNALDFGFQEFSHNGHKGGVDRNISAVLAAPDVFALQALLGPDFQGGLANGPPFNTPLALIWEWFNKLKERGAYVPSTE
jgi:hypothetical protein